MPWKLIKTEEEDPEILSDHEFIGIAIALRNYPYFEGSSDCENVWYKALNKMTASWYGKPIEELGKVPFPFS